MTLASGDGAMRLLLRLLFILSSSFSVSLHPPSTPLTLLSLSLLLPVCFLLASHHHQHRLQGAVGLFLASLCSALSLLLPSQSPVFLSSLQIFATLGLALFFPILVSTLRLAASHLRFPQLLILPWLVTFPLGLLIASLLPSSGPLLFLPPVLLLVHSFLALMFLETERGQGHQGEDESSGQLSYTSSSLSISSSSSVTVYPSRPRALILTSGVSAPDLHFSSLSSDSSYQRSDFFLRLLEEQDEATTFSEVVMSPGGIESLLFHLITSATLPLISSPNPLYILTAASVAPLPAGLIFFLTGSVTALPTLVLLLAGVLCLLIPSQPIPLLPSFVSCLVITTSLFLPLVHLPSPPQLTLQTSSLLMGIAMGMSLSLLPSLPPFTSSLLILLSILTQARALYKETMQCWAEHKTHNLRPSSVYDFLCCR